MKTRGKILEKLAILFALTGWGLTLAEPVVSGKGGMSVCLSNESSLFSGPPDPQKEGAREQSQTTQDKKSVKVGVA